MLVICSLSRPRLDLSLCPSSLPPLWTLLLTNRRAFFLFSPLLSFSLVFGVASLKREQRGLVFKITPVWKRDATCDVYTSSEASSTTTMRLWRELFYSLLFFFLLSCFNKQSHLVKCSITAVCCWSFLQLFLPTVVVKNIFSEREGERASERGRTKP